MKQSVNTNRPDSVSTSLLSERDMKMDSVPKKLYVHLTTVVTDTHNHSEKGYVRLETIVIMKIRRRRKEKIKVDDIITKHEKEISIMMEENLISQIEDSNPEIKSRISKC